MSTRDDFSIETKEILAKRVGMQCSNPNCRQPTSGPRSAPRKTVNIGVAAHITGASKNGARYDPRMSAQERRSIENGIWLCQNCAKLVDNDEKLYTVDVLRQWKKLSEEAARLAVEQPRAVKRGGPTKDANLVRFFAQCFDRPAFQDPFMREGSMEAFDKAIEDTITAINTGCLRSRDGAVLGKARGKAFLSNVEWRRGMDTIVDLLRAIRSRYDAAKKSGQIHVHEHPSGEEFYDIRDPAVAHWMDATRAQVLEMFGQICREASVTPPVFPRRFPRSGW